VFLYNKESRLGGLLPLTALLKDIEINDLMDLVRYYKTQFRKLGVKIKLGQEVNNLIVEQINLDIIIIASGGNHTIPGISGIQGLNVLTGAILHQKLKFYLRFFSPTVL
jgi:hypothetical protein